MGTELYTSRDLSELFGQRLHVVTYALLECGIKPERKAGNVRLFSESQLPLIRAAIERTGRRPLRKDA